MKGRFVAPEKTPYSQRSLAPGSSNSPYNVYEVTQPVTGLRGKTAPHFGEVGGGIQYKLDKSIKQLLDNKSIKRISQ